MMNDFEDAHGDAEAGRGPGAATDRGGSDFLQSKVEQMARELSELQQHFLRPPSNSACEATTELKTRRTEVPEVVWDDQEKRHCGAELGAMQPETAPAFDCRTLLHILRALLPEADLRALGVMRIFLGLLVISELLRTYWDRAIWLLDDGVSPRSRVVASGAWSACLDLYLAAGQEFPLFVLVSLHLTIAAAVTLGYHTQKVSMLLYLVDSGFEFRTTCYQNSSSSVRRALLFWSIFMPTGVRFAVRPERQGSLSIAGLLLTTQYFLIYYIGALCKYGDDWVNGTTLWHVFHLRGIASHALAPVFANFPGLCWFLTRSTIYAEMYGPVLLFGPAKIRFLAIGLFLSLHIGIEMCLATGQFQHCMVTGLLAMMPPFACDYIANQIQQLPNRCHPKRQKTDSDRRHKASLGETLLSLFHRGLDLVKRSLRTNGIISTSPTVSMSIIGGAGFSTVVGLTFLYSICVMNCRYLQNWVPNGKPKFCPASSGYLPQRLKNVVSSLGMEQEWRMFAPVPPNPGVWHRIAGLQRNGVVVDLFHGGRPSVYLPPLWSGDIYQPPPVLYGDQRWCKYFEFTRSPGACNMLDFGAYICRKWREHDNSVAQLHGFVILQFMENINVHTYTVGAPTYEVMHYQWCHDEGQAAVVVKDLQHAWWLTQR